MVTADARLKCAKMQAVARRGDSIKQTGAEAAGTAGAPDTPGTSGIAGVAGMTQQGQQTQYN